MNYKITYPTTLFEVNITNDNIDVLVSCDNGKNYSFVVATIKNVEQLLENGILNPNTKILIVDELKEDKIEQVINLAMKNEKIASFYGED